MVDSLDDSKTGPITCQIDRKPFRNSEELQKASRGRKATEGMVLAMEQTKQQVKRGGLMQKTRGRRQLTYQGLIIKNRLMELNMTQKDLADKLQMGNGYLTDILRGRRPGTKYMDKIFSELGIEDKAYQKACGG